MVIHDTNRSDAHETASLCNTTKHDFQLRFRNAQNNIVVKKKEAIKVKSAQTPRQVTKKGRRRRCPARSAPVGRFGLQIYRLPPIPTSIGHRPSLGPQPPDGRSGPRGEKQMRKFEKILVPVDLGQDTR